MNVELCLGKPSSYPSQLRSHYDDYALDELFFVPCHSTIANNCMRAENGYTLSMNRKRAPVSVRSGRSKFLKLNTERWQWRDAYQWLLGLSWPQFAAFVGAVYIALNLIFAALYTLAGDTVSGMRPGSFLDAFFFSVQTVATVGYGNMSRTSLRGHPHHDRNHDRHLFGRGHGRPDLCPVFAAERAHRL